MSPLIKIRSERDQMSAIERRIADFILENAQLLRDYSSQQLANALRISQSSVVKFSQKLGFKGYPDLKYSIGEAIARADNDEATVDAAAEDSDPTGTHAIGLWRRKSEAEEETRLINPPDAIDAIAQAIGNAGKVFIIGLGEDDIHARAFALKLSLLGILTVHNFDTAHMNSGSRIGICCCARLTGTLTRTTPRGSALRRSTTSRAAVASASIIWACRYTLLPTSVTAKRRVERCSSRTPRSLSSCVMRRLSRDLGMPSARSAAANPPCSTTIAK